MSRESRQQWTEHLTKREMHASLEKKRSKYGAKRVEINGIVFDSKKEARRWQELVLMQQAGQITDLRRQVPFHLYAHARVAGMMASCPVGEYIADFSYERNHATVIEDVKSAATRNIALYRLKKKIVEANYGITINEI